MIRRTDGQDCTPAQIIFPACNLLTFNMFFVMFYLYVVHFPFILHGVWIQVICIDPVWFVVYIKINGIKINPDSLHRVCSVQIARKSKKKLKYWTKIGISTGYSLFTLWQWARCVVPERYNTFVRRGKGNLVIIKS